jgi:hypothetical protein
MMDIMQKHDTIRSAKAVRVLSLVTTLALGCGARESAQEGATTQAVSTPPEASRHCTPAGLETAQALPMVVLPQGCSFVSPGVLQAPLVLSTEEGFVGHLHCEGASPPVVDFEANDVLVVGHTASPAYGGGAVLDDGARVSFVTMQRTPCPGEYPPTPTPMSFAFLLPKGATRTWGEAMCTLAPHCP